MSIRRVPCIVAVLVLAFVVASAPAAGQATLTRAEIERFLLAADLVKAVPIERGITRPLQLTLSDGTLTHDAAFTTVEQRNAVKKFDDGQQELNFVDSYHYNIAAYRLTELLGLGDMMPVTVERQFLGKKGSASWWVDDKLMEEGQRLKKKVRAPDVQAWNQQMYRMRVFSQLVYDTDRNLGNVLIDKNWKLWMIDFTRAFRLWRKLPSPGDLHRCDRRLLEKLRELDVEAVTEKTAPHLSKSEIEAIIARRDLLVAHFENLIAEKGEAQVLY